MPTRWSPGWTGRRTAVTVRTSLFDDGGRLVAQATQVQAVRG